ncbi:zinc finger protein 614-like [Topomyia yanbarensis]|uniref:zinc finger protein 614-like n=1 Tax=Topomyia yanbarensis TaxID=2498891 RepID=UPI00273CC4FB|nr:zinc finger protein 614-like [Topomyia yanbarensis]
MEPKIRKKYVRKTIQIRPPRCRLCKNICEANKLLWDRDFREKLQDVICLWIKVVPTEKFHICSACQTTVEDFYAFKSQSRKVLRGEIVLEPQKTRCVTSPPKTDNDCTNENHELPPTLETLLDDCEDEIVLPAQTVEDISLQVELTKKKPRRSYRRKDNKEVRLKRPPHRKTEEEKTMTPAEYRKHWNQMYRDRYKVMCDICGKTIQKVLIESHLNRHRGVQPYACEQCGLQFHCKNNFRKHVQRSHAINDEVACEICDKVLVSQIAYKQHLRSVHRERKFQCVICGLKIHSKRALEQHMDIHNQKRDFVCPHCGKTFYRQYVLNIHLRTHSGETPYVCHICKAAFVHRRIYVMHMQKLHPNEPMMRMDGVKTLKDALMKRENF